MPPAFVVLFWLWTAASVVILASRLVRRTTRPRPTTASPPAPAAQPSVSTAVRAAPVAAVPTGPPVPSRLGELGRPSLADLLAGIRMPCDLAPLTMSGGDDAARSRLAFATTGLPAPIVEQALHDEYQRLGLEVARVGDTLVARRGDDAVYTKLFTTGGLVNGVASDRFPSAPPDAVVVEIATGQ